MATTVRAKLSERNKYWIDKHRHYELKHFCLQYPTWKKAYVDSLNGIITVAALSGVQLYNSPTDPTSLRAIVRAHYAKRIEIIEQAAKEADQYLWEYILKAVTEGRSYTYLRTRLDIPCGKDMYYDRYRKFFWLLNEMRD